MRLRSALWAAGLRYRLHARTPQGRPDVVFPGPRVAVFIDGCFWHGCPLHYVRPRTRYDFWAQKLRTNVARDRRQTNGLEAVGWRVVRAMEHRVFEDLKGVVSDVSSLLAGGEPDRCVDWRVVRVDVVDMALDLERRHLEDLRDPTRTRTVEGPRTTRKWRRPAGAVATRRRGRVGKGSES